MCGIIGLRNGLTNIGGGVVFFCATFIPANWAQEPIDDRFTHPFLCSRMIFIRFGGNRLHDRGAGEGRGVGRQGDVPRAAVEEQGVKNNAYLPRSTLGWHRRTPRPILSLWAGVPISSSGDSRGVVRRCGSVRVRFETWTATDVSESPWSFRDPGVRKKKNAARALDGDEGTAVSAATFFASG